MRTVACRPTMITRLLLVIGLAATSFGKNHDVEWTVGTKMGTLCVELGDSVTFLYEGDSHNVVEVTREGFNKCTGFKSTLGMAGPVTVTPDKIGEHFFACGVGRHCEFHQKLHVNVNLHGNCGVKSRH